VAVGLRAGAAVAGGSQAGARAGAGAYAQGEGAGGDGGAADLEKKAAAIWGGRTHDQRSGSPRDVVADRGCAEARPGAAGIKPSSGQFEAPNTWLPGPALGVFFHLYLILDIWSRKIAGWEVHDRENGELAALVIERAVWAEGCVTRPLTLHADNGSPMKAATLRVTLERLGVTASYSRPRVSNDNPFSDRGESLSVIADAMTAGGASVSFGHVRRILAAAD